jgi:UDP-2,3-diacylglucosamine pyrophosphatase LpxH
MQNFKSVIISDLHLGTDHSKVKEVITFLKHSSFEKLILNGDIIDAWQLKKRGKWKKKDAKFLQYIIKLIIKKNIEVIYVRGNHDDFLETFLPFEIPNFRICKSYIHENTKGNYFVIHGDLFDTVTSKLRWLAHLGDIGYTLLLKSNKIYNDYRLKRGLPYYSISQKIKAGVKQAVNFVSDFEVELAKQAKLKKCEGIICGHIHTPANKYIDGIHYLNSGDWVESCTALVEHTDGAWEIITFHEWNTNRLKVKANVNLLLKSSIGQTTNE